jgi:hypothetical protein
MAFFILAQKTRISRQTDVHKGGHPREDAVRAKQPLQQQLHVQLDLRPMKCDLMVVTGIDTLRRQANQSVSS